MCRSRCITKAKFRRIKSWHGSDSSVNHFSTNFSQTLLLKQVGMSRWTHSLKIWNKDVGEKTKPKLKKVFLKLKLYGISYQQNKSSKLCISWVVGFTVLMNVTRRIHTLSAVKSSSYMDITATLQFITRSLTVTTGDHWKSGTRVCESEKYQYRWTRHFRFPEQRFEIIFAFAC